MFHPKSNALTYNSYMKIFFLIIITTFLLVSCNTYCESSTELRQEAISDYLVKVVGENYLKGEVCIPAIMIVAEENADSAQSQYYGDFWVFWYNIAGDTLKTVSGGNHSGCMALCRQNGTFKVTGFEQTVDGAGNEASAKQIFGEHYDVYRRIHSNEDMRETARKEQLQDYVKRNGLNVYYYQDYGWLAVTLFK